MTTTTLSPRRRWSMLLCALVAAMTTTCAVNGFAYLIPALHTDRGMPLTQAAVLATIPTIGLMILIIPWGVALDRYGERRILILSLCITLAGTTGAAAAAAADAPYWVLGVALFIGGLGSGAANGASGRIVVGWFPANLRGTAMGIRQMAQPLGIGFCALTMPAIAHAFGITPALAVPAAVTLLGLGAVVFGIIDPPAHTASPSTPQTRTENPYRRSSFLARVHAISALLVIPQSMLWTFVPTWLIVAHDWAPAPAGLLITVSQILGAAGRIAAGRISDLRGSRMQPVRWIALAAGAAMAVLAITDWLDSPIAPVIMIVATIASVSDNGLAFTAIAEYAGPSWSGRGLAVQNTAQYLMTAGVTPAFGAVIATVGFPVAFAVAAVMPFVALPLIPADPEHD